MQRRKIRTRRPELGAALAAALLCLAACGSGAVRYTAPPPTLPHGLATALAARSDAVAAALAAGDSCRASTLAQDLQRRAISAINEGRVPVVLQEPLVGAANELAARISCGPRPIPVLKDRRARGKHKGHEKKHEGDD